MTKFIGIAGHKQVGKDLSAKLLTQMLTVNGQNVTTTYFASILKDMCIDILGLSRGAVYGTDADKNAMSHIKWDDMPEAIKRKYGIESTDGVPFYNGDGSIDIVRELKPRSGPMSNREVLQIMGTDIFRKLYNNVWVDSLFRKNWSEFDYVIVPDVRFPNELLAIEEHGGIVIRVERNTGLNDNHASEIALDNVDFAHKINNNGTIEELEQKLKEIINGL